MVKKTEHLIFWNQVSLKLLQLMLFHDIIHGMHTPKNAILTEWEIMAPQIVSWRAYRHRIGQQGKSNSHDMYHGNAAMIVSLGTL